MLFPARFAMIGETFQERVKAVGHWGFSYVGLIYLLLLFIPNGIWARNQPAGYTAEGENRSLVALERVGEVLVTVCALIFEDFNWHGWSPWCWWFIASALLMLLYELWWVRYFRSEKTLRDFYSSLFGIPVAGATLPVLAFFLLGIYGKVVWMIAAAVILGVGHIGIHLQHRCGLKKERKNDIVR